MSNRVYSAAINGIDATPIEVEVDSTPGLHAFNIVGLPDKAVEESKDRIGSAIRNSGFVPPSAKTKKIIVNLAPADVKKEGPSYDVPIAMGFLLETGQIKFDATKRLFAGELSLDGSLKHTSGILAMALLAKKMGLSELIVPAHNAKEAAVVRDLTVIGAKTIKDIIGHLDGTTRIVATVPVSIENVSRETFEDSPLLHIKGQYAAKRALTIAAAGGHNILMSGAPGSGKTILARALVELLPRLSMEEAIEVAKIYSAVGLIKDAPLSLKRPFRSPHHTTSPAAIVGGGTWPKPGEISLAHRGVLFLDELPEFHRNVLESLRQPLEDGVITVARAAGSVILPAKFTLVAAMNPCPCGNYGDPSVACVCSPLSVLRYRKKISGPLLDRIDVQVGVSRETIQDGTPMTVASIQEIESTIKSVQRARVIQVERFAPTHITSKYPIFTNAEISYKNIDKYCILEPTAEKLLKQAINARGLSLRAYHKVKKLARTIADLELSGPIAERHVAEAVGLRVNERLFSELG